jgi:hypothetical protein
VSKRPNEQFVKAGSLLLRNYVLWANKQNRQIFAEAVAQGRSGGGAVRNVVLDDVSRWAMECLRSESSTKHWCKRVEWLCKKSE